MGVTSSELDRSGQAQASWSLKQVGWSSYAMARYGMGYSVTGVAASLALPRLLRRRLQDWRVEGFCFHIGPDFISFGRDLWSLSREDSNMFYGVDIKVGEHGSSWFYCKATEWQLQLHKAVIEPVSESIAESSVSQDRRFPGRAYYLGDEPPPAAIAANRRALQAAKKQQDDAEAGAGETGADAKQESASGQEGEGLPAALEQEPVTHQLSVFLGNADGHVGLLCVPMPGSKVDAVSSVIAHWAETWEAPCFWAGRWWRTTEDFAQLREETVNLPDLLLLALEPEMAMSLTPDWTWEKYPRGYGEIAKSSYGSLGDRGLAAQGGSAPEEASSASEEAPATEPPPAQGFSES